jgi:hypothetical protein
MNHARLLPSDFAAAHCSHWPKAQAFAVNPTKRRKNADPARSNIATGLLARANDDVSSSALLLTAGAYDGRHSVW